jgi:hypothetical protein
VERREKMRKRLFTLVVALFMLSAVSNAYATIVLEPEGSEEAITVSPSSANVGGKVTISVTVKNKDSTPETETVEIDYSHISTIKIKDWSVSLSGNEIKTLSYEWTIPPILSDYSSIDLRAVTPHDEAWKYGAISLTNASAAGGIAVPTNKFELLVPYLGLSLTIFATTIVTATHVKRVKHRKEKQ